MWALQHNCLRGVPSEMVIVLGNGIGDRNSNPEGGCISLRANARLWVNSLTVWVL